MRRLLRAIAVATTIAVAVTSCGGSTPITPTPGGGGGGNGGGGVVTPPNTPPTVKSVTASTTRVEVGTPVTLTATVEDAETPVDNLTYGWTFPATGSASGTGTGRVITWTPSADLKTPADFEITVTVTERYTSNGVQAENKATGTITVHVNNSPKELQELSLRFLGDFANSRVSPETCVSEFSDTTSPCARGKKDELADVSDNRHDFEILASSLRHTGLSIAGDRNSATVHTSCAFTSRVITTSPVSGGCKANPDSCKFGAIQQADGDCWTTNVYEKGRWWLCESHYTPKNTIVTPFERAFFGISGGQ